MGAGNRISASDFIVSEIDKTNGCPLARVMRRELRAQKIKNVKCVYAPSVPDNLNNATDDSKLFKIQNASISFVPPVMGYLLAGEVVRDLLQKAK